MNSDANLMPKPRVHPELADHHWEPPDWLTAEEAAAVLGVTEGRLAAWRSKAIGPGYFTVGTRLVRYPREEVERWAEEPPTYKAVAEDLGSDPSGWPGHEPPKA